MNSFITLSLIAIITAPIFAADTIERYLIIPKPVSMIAADGTFTITPSTRILINSMQAKELALYIADFFSARLNNTMQIGALTAIPLSSSIAQIGTTKSLPTLGTISIIIDSTSDIESEGYQLTITPDNITINAKTPTGAFWAFSSLRQLMPPQTQRATPIACALIKVPCVTIKDAPRFAYRGLHLDVSRHFFPTHFIKKYIDLMAFYKLNTFHWHLVDDQGWRIEIKKYPRLQEVAAMRDQTIVGHTLTFPQRFDGKPYGGYYTQNEIKEIVAYAATRHITIIPEIELPGHSVAALAAYPELGCTGGPYKTRMEWGISNDLYCAGNEATFTFLQDVLTEVIELFPSTYIHIGGDEAPKDRWTTCTKCQARIKTEKLKDEHELQSYCVTRIEKFLNAKGRQIIGWDEILEGGLSPNATVMSWRGTQGGIDAAKLNHNVIMTPHKNLYFDYYQSQSPYEPLAIGSYLPTEKVYSYEPVPTELNEQQKQYILGAQANVWTEYMGSSEHVEYMVFPRAAALAELVWTPTTQKNYGDFCNRLRYNLGHLRSMSVQYADWQTN